MASPARRWVVALSALLVAVPVAGSGQMLSPKIREAVIRYAKARQFQTGDLEALVRAVALMAQRPKRASLTRCTTPLKLVEGRREFAATLLVNPVCGECDRVVDLLKTLARDTPGEAPVIWAGEVPSLEEASIEAVALLHGLNNEPDARTALLQELMARQPTTVQAVRTIARGYAPTLVDRRELGQLRDEPPCDDVSTPVLVYRDRVLERVRDGRVAFDPLRNIDSIRLALNAVDDLQSHVARSYQDGQTGSVCRNSTLLRAVRIMDAACTSEFCNAERLRRLEGLNRTNLLESLRDPHLMAVHLFFPHGKTRLADALDWAAIKKDQLRTISNLNDPNETVVFIIGNTSKREARNVSLSRDRMFGVYFYLKNVLGVRCKYIKGVGLGGDILRLRPADAKLLGLASRDFRNDPQILNQAVHVFIYPCAASI